MTDVQLEVHDDTGEGLEMWLASLLPERALGQRSAAVVSALMSHPGRATYGTAQEIAQLAQVNTATVTRTAQYLGFAGWPDLQREFRARYLSHLSAHEVAEQHGVTTSPAVDSLRRDLENVAALTRSPAHEQIATLAQAIVGASRTFIVGDGSFAALALSMSHTARLAGYDVEAVTGSGPDVSNRLAFLRSTDVVVVISFWRLYQTAVLTTQIAEGKGARVFVITDTSTTSLAKWAEGVIVVPAEGVAFFPSMTAGMAVLQAILAQVCSIDPSRTRGAVTAAEAQWDNFDLLHRRTTTRPTRN